MSWEFGWVATKLDQRGKRHMYGRIHMDGRVFVSHGLISEKPFIHLNEKFLYYEYASSGRTNKVKEGYKLWEPDKFIKAFPAVIDEINFRFVINKLKK